MPVFWQHTAVMREVGTRRFQSVIYLPNFLGLVCNALNTVDRPIHGSEIWGTVSNTKLVPERQIEQNYVYMGR